jgi:hypothetical protein
MYMYNNPYIYNRTEVSFTFSRESCVKVDMDNGHGLPLLFLVILKRSPPK